MVRTSVTLAIGATTPRRHHISCRSHTHQVCNDQHKGAQTAEEASQMLRLICVSYTINDTIVLVCLHPSLDTIEGKCSKSGNDTSAAGSYLCAIVRCKPLGGPLSSPVFRHDSERQSVDGNISATPDDPKLGTVLGATQRRGCGAIRGQVLTIFVVEESLTSARSPLSS